MIRFQKEPQLKVANITKPEFKAKHKPYILPTAQTVLMA
jgi:hypothetical protein